MKGTKFFSYANFNCIEKVQLSLLKKKNGKWV